MRSDKWATQVQYGALSLALGLLCAFVGGGWLVFAPRELFKPDFHRTDLILPFGLLWLVGSIAVRCLVHLIIERSQL